MRKSDIKPRTFIEGWGGQVRLILAVRDGWGKYEAVTPCMSKHRPRMAGHTAWVRLSTLVNWGKRVVDYPPKALTAA